MNMRSGMKRFCRGHFKCRGSSSVTVLLSVVVLLPVQATLVRADELSDAYQESTRLMKEEKYLEAIPYTNAAYEASLKKYGRLHKTTTTLALNLGTVTLFAGQFEEARPLLRRAVEITEAVEGTDAFNLVEPLIRLAQALATTHPSDSRRKVRWDMIEADNLYKRAIDIAEARLQREQIAGIELEAAMVFARSPFGTELGLAYAESALDGFSSRRSVNVEALARVNLWVGILRIRSEEFEKGQQALESPLALENADQISDQTRRAIHVELIRLFESRGERDEATSHIESVSSLSSLEGRSLSQIAPIYWKNPDWRKLKRLPNEEKTLIVEFGISADGYVFDPKIVQGIEDAIDDAVLSSLERWRFALPNDNGVVHPVDNIRYEISVPTRSQARNLRSKITGLETLPGISDRPPIGDVVSTGLSRGG